MPLNSQTHTACKLYGVPCQRQPGERTHVALPQFIYLTRGGRDSDSLPDHETGDHVASGRHMGDQVGHDRHQTIDLQQTRNTCADGRDWRLTERRQRQQSHTDSGISRPWANLTLTISTNVRRYQTHHRWQFFSFRKTVHRCIVCVTQSYWVKIWFSRFSVLLPGSAEAQVT